MPITPLIKSYTQTNSGNPSQVFPLLCPVREADWLFGWSFTMIYSKSGVIEKDCVFTTPHHGELETIWTVTKYNPFEYYIEFIRVTPQESLVKIQISLSPLMATQTSTEITYTYTPLTDEENLISELGSDFEGNMMWWEKAINYYLETGKKLIPPEDHIY